jgi:hypothetical protein
MRIRTALVLLVTLAAVGAATLEVPAAQAPARGAGRAAGTPSSAARAHANLAQVMRGVTFPASNVIFAAQSTDPATVKPAADPATSPDPLSSVYGGWQAVENSGLALAESANLLIVPGRMCQNGRPAPIQNADWQKWVEGLRAAGMTAYKAAQSKNQDAIVDAAGEVADACANCHNKYRDVPTRCQ